MAPRLKAGPEVLTTAAAAFDADPAGPDELDELVLEPHAASAAASAGTSRTAASVLLNFTNPLLIYEMMVFISSRSRDFVNAR
jgi:hypothetical protein